MNQQSHLSHAARAFVTALCCSTLIVPINAFASPSGVYIAKRDWLLHNQLIRGLRPDGADIILAQSGEPDSKPESAADRLASSAQRVSEKETARIIKRISDSRDFCYVVPVPFRINCLQTQFDRIARSLPQTGDYAPVRKVLQDASEKLGAVVRGNIDTTVKPIVPVIKNKPDAPRSEALVAIKPAAVRKANAAAAAIIAETTTLLLRSTENLERREVSYQEIAQAIDSTKILLRSA